MTQQKQVKLGWETIHTAIDSLAYVLEPLKLLGIIGVARGGLIPATMLSHKMGLILNTFTARSYNDKTNERGHKVDLSGITPFIREYILANPCRFAIVDDVLDSGHTLDAIREIFPITPFVCLVSKRPILPVQYFATVPHDVWVKFPWE